MEMPGTRCIRDPVSGNIYFVNGQNPYYERKLLKRVKCGLGHQMWVNALNVIMCDHKKCQAKIKCQDYDELK